MERSTDGTNYSYIGEIKARGQASAYSYWDESPVTGLNHYRLKMFDQSGRFSYSKSVSTVVAIKASFVVEAYPNPITDYLNVRINGDIGNNAIIIVTDVTGKLVQKVEVKKSDISINMKNAAAGMYLLKYNDDDHTQTLKISKK
jgi:hypothetical protein